MRVAVLSSLALSAIMSAPACLAAQPASSGGQARQSFLRHHLADYGAQLRGPDRRIDTDAMVTRLKELGDTTCYWLIGYGKRDWEDLQLFLPKAAAAGIDVWVYLLPPTESGPRAGGTYSEPFRLDYVRWGDELGKLSLKHPNLKAWAIDDFCQNLTVFTPDYLHQMQAAAKKSRPDFRFLPLMYFHDITREFVDKYREVIDGVIVAYPRDRTDIDSAWAVLNDVCLARSTEINLDSNTTTHAGDYGAAVQEATVLKSPNYRIRFTQCEQFTRKVPGYHFKQLRVDDAVVWEDDVSGGTPAWQEVDVDVTKQVQGKARVKIDFRVQDKKGVGNFAIRWSLRGLKPEGLQLVGFDQPEKWTASRKGPFQVGFGAELKPGQRQFHIPIIVMTAAQTSEFRQRHGAPATPERIAEWVRMCLQAWRDGRCDGVVTYCLDKRPGSPVFTAVQNEFQQFRSLGFPGDTAASDVQPTINQQLPPSKPTK